VAPWLTLGSLRSYESALALHALQPALSRHWRCPGCRQQLLATHQQVLAHVAGCAAALALPREVIERCGYEPGGRGQEEGQEEEQGQGQREEQQEGQEGQEQAAGAAAGDGPGGAAAAGEAAGEAGSSGQEEQEAPAASLAAVPAAGSGRYQQQAFTWAGLRGQVAALTEKQGRVKWGRRLAAAGSKGKEAAAWAQLGLGKGLGPGAQGEGEGQEPGQQQLQLDVQQVLEGVFAAGPQEEPAAGAGGGGGAAEEGGPARQEFVCPACGLRALLTSVEVLQHRRSHA
jgi:hypothetical protein